MHAVEKLHNIAAALRCIFSVETIVSTPLSPQFVHLLENKWREWENPLCFPAKRETERERKKQKIGDIKDRIDAASSWYILTTAEREGQGSRRSAEERRSGLFSVKLSVCVYQSVRVCVRASVSGFFSGRLIFPFNCYRHRFCLLPSCPPRRLQPPLALHPSSSGRKHTTSQGPSLFCHELCTPATMRNSKPRK